MRNIKRVVLWGLPPSFCALVQRGGRAGRDFETLGEAILIVSAATIRKGVTEIEVEEAVEAAAEEGPVDDGGDAKQDVEGPGLVEVAAGNEEVLVNEGGIRVSHDSDEEGVDNAAEQEGVGRKSKKRKKASKGYNEREARYLSLYASGKRCRRAIWNEFFGNYKKSKCSGIQD